MALLIAQVRRGAASIPLPLRCRRSAGSGEHFGCSAREHEGGRARRDGEALSAHQSKVRAANTQGCVRVVMMCLRLVVPSTLDATAVNLCLSVCLCAYEPGLVPQSFLFFSGIRLVRELDWMQLCSVLQRCDTLGPRHVCPTFQFFFGWNSKLNSGWVELPQAKPCSSNAPFVWPLVGMGCFASGACD